MRLTGRVAGEAEVWMRDAEWPVKQRFGGVIPSGR